MRTWFRAISVIVIGEAKKRDASLDGFTHIRRDFEAQLDLCMTSALCCAARINARWFFGLAEVKDTQSITTQALDGVTHCQRDDFVIELAHPLATDGHIKPSGHVDFSAVPQLARPLACEQELGILCAHPGRHFRDGAQRTEYAVARVVIRLQPALDLVFPDLELD